MKRESQRLLVSAIPASLAAVAVAAPYLALGSYGALTLLIFLFFSPVCHQDPARSLWLFGGPVAVCARCLGIYLGAAAGAWIRAPRRILLAGFVLFAALNLADVLTEAVAWHGNWKLTRFFLGLFLGGASSGLIAEALTSGAKARGLVRPLRHG